MVLDVVLVCWPMMHDTSPLVASVPSEEELDELGAAPARLPQAHYSEWFIRMRWIATIVAAIFIIISVRVVPLLPESVLWPLLLTLLALVGSNCVYAVVTSRRCTGGGLLQAQIYSDLVILVVFLHFSGGIENPLSMAMLLHVIIGGIILTRWQCFLVAAVCSTLLAAMAVMEAGEIIPHYTLQVFPHAGEDEAVHHAAHEPLYVSVRVSLQASLLFLAAYFVTSVSGRLRLHERRLRGMANAARAQNQLLERSLETTGAALRVLGPDLRPQWSNTRWQIWFGAGALNAEGAEQLNGPASAASRTIQDGVARETEVGIDEFDRDALDLSGVDARCYRVTTASLRDAEGRVHQVVELAQDTTEHKRAQAQLIRAGQLAAVGELAGQVAHEVNNPIAIIGAKSRLLLSDHRESMSEEVAEELGKVISLSDRVARIAQGLLSYCRQSAAARAELDIRTSVRTALGMIEQHASGFGVTVVTGLQHEVLPVLANEQELEQVFLNLLLNAVDAMPGGGTLSVSARQMPATVDGGAARVVVEIEDTGGGIPASTREHVFRPFFTTKKRGRGTGLGLSICQGLVTSHGGSIALVSQEGKGTRVTVSLPVTAGTERQGEGDGE